MRAKHFSGLGVELHPKSSVRQSDYFILMNGQETTDQILARQAHGVSKNLVLEELKIWMTQEDELDYDAEKKVYYRERIRKIGEIEIDRQRTIPDLGEIKELVQKDISLHFENYISEQYELCDTVQKIKWMKKFFAEKKEVFRTQFQLDFEVFENLLSPESLFVFAAMLLEGEKNFSQVKTKNWNDMFEVFLDSEHYGFRQKLEKLFPSVLILPKHRKRIQYLSEGVSVEAKIQDFFGLKSHPKIFNEQIPLRLTMLGPHRRPVQITSDLMGFWKTSYPEIRKELRGQYPRHPWPENPMDDIEES